MRALVVVAAVVTAAVSASGCAGGQSRPDDARERERAPTLPTAVDPDTASAPAEGGAVSGVDPAAVATARAFTLAARTWSATTLRRNWRRQITLAAGDLRETLRASAPTAADLAHLRADDASSSATILDLTPTRATTDTTRLVLRLQERVTAAGTTTAQTTANQLDLVRRGTTWRVTSFTLAEGPP